MISKLSLIFLMFSASVGFAKVRFSFQEEEIPKVIDTYSKYTGEKFMLNGSVRGRITITAADDLSNEEAYNLLSSALAINGYAILKQGDVNIVLPVHELQRNKIETTTILPAAKPERMVTLMYTVSRGSPANVTKDIQGLISKDGDVTPAVSNEKVLLITDWSSNLQRIHEVLLATNPPPSKAKKSLARKETRGSEEASTSETVSTSTKKTAPLMDEAAVAEDQAAGKPPRDQAPTGSSERPYQTKPMSAQDGTALPWKKDESSVR